MQLGGQATIRGYPENSFRAVRYAVARPEISLGETETRIYLFTDLAVVKTDEDEIRFPAGSGAGIRGRSGMFHADAAVGFPLQEGLGSSRLYLRLRASI
jgi:hemolysin activation/secretion protein